MERTGGVSVKSFAAALQHVQRVAFSMCIFCAVLATVASEHGDDSGPAVRLVPSFGTFGPLKTFACWQLPEGPVRKILIIFNLRNNPGPTDFWDMSSKCPVCRGLPEKRKLTVDALSRNYAVFMPVSLMEYGNWDEAPPDNADMENVLAVFADWRKSHGLETVPTVAIGISAGGFAVHNLALHAGLFDAIAMMVNGGLVSVWESVPSTFPPVFFFYMPADDLVNYMVRFAREHLTAAGVPNVEKRWYPHSMTPEWFTEMIPLLNHSLAIAVHQKLIDEEWLDPDTNFLLNEDYLLNWNDAVERWNILPEGHLGELLSVCILEEVNVAYAVHSTVARDDEDLFDWFEGSYKNWQQSDGLVASF